MNWFTKQHPQQVTLKNYTGLCGKAPTKAKRLRMGFVLDLTAGDVKGLPEWLADARDFVMKTGQTVTEKLQVSGINLTFGEANLFKKKPVEAPHCDLRKFSVYQAGEEDNPSTLLGFTVYAPFSADLNRWAGQMNGESFTATSEGALPDVGDVLAVAVNSFAPTDKDDDSGDDSEDEDEDEDEDDEESDEDEAQLAMGGDGDEDELSGQERRRMEKLNATTQAMRAANDPRRIADAKRNLASIQ